MYYILELHDIIIHACMHVYDMYVRVRVTLIVQTICMESEKFIMIKYLSEYKSSLRDHRISILEVVNNFGEHGLSNPSVCRHK